MQKGLGITVDDVSWSVKQKKQKILYPLSFELSPGKILGVVGPNGAGKSTLLRLLYRYYKPTTGKIKINGIDIWKLTSRQVACSIATVLQENSSDFSLTVMEIVTLGRTPYSKWLSNSNSENDKKIVQSSIDRLSLKPFHLLVRFSFSCIRCFYLSCNRNIIMLLYSCQSYLYDILHEYLDTHQTLKIV